MNKKIKSLLMAGVVTVAVGFNTVSSSALCKNSVNVAKKKSSIILFINGIKHSISIGCNKPSGDNNTNIDNNGQNNNTTVDNDNSQESDNTVIEDNNVVDNNTNIGNNEENNNDIAADDYTYTEATGEFASFQKEVVRLVNIERAKQGLKELTFNIELSNVATLKSQDMINKNYFSHTSPTYGSPFNMMKQFNISYRTAGENIAKGQKTPAAVVEAWMNSQGHRENILNSNYTEIGIGVAKDSNGTIYWTQMFIGK